MRDAWWEKGEVRGLTMLVCLLAQIIALCLPHWLELGTLGRLDTLSPTFRFSQAALSNYSHHDATFSIGVYSAVCRSKKKEMIGCRKGSFFQRTPPEPATVGATDWYDAYFYIRDFWEPTDKNPVMRGREGERVTQMEEVTRQQLPRWDAGTARKQLAAIKMLSAGHHHKATISCLSLSIVSLASACITAGYTFEYEVKSFSDVSRFLTSSLFFTIGAIGAWAPVHTTLAAAFGGYDEGHPGACLYLTVFSGVVLLISIGLRCVPKLYCGRGSSRHRDSERELQLQSVPMPITAGPDMVQPQIEIPGMPHSQRFGV